MIPLDLPPMEAKVAAELPQGEGWQFEPKWDGFRCLAHRNGDDVVLMSKSGKALGRYFPEIVSLLAGLPEPCFVLDGELVVPVGDRLSFGALQARLHPAASRIVRLSGETPAQFVLFDLLALGSDVILDRPLVERRQALERFHARHGGAALLLSPAAQDSAVGKAWLAVAGEALDGVIAKRLDAAYAAGERAMVKVKPERTADCVIGGYRRASKGNALASLLLGLHDEEGRLHHVGFTSALTVDQRLQFEHELTPGEGFSGRAPGGPSRWATERSSAWIAVVPDVVIEVAYDQVSDERFRHGTRYIRRRPDKSPAQCKLDQLALPLGPTEVVRRFEQS